MRNNYFLRLSKLLLLVTLLGGCYKGSSYEGHTQVHSPFSNEEYPNSDSFAALSEQPHQIALLLPLSGQHADSAKAIREGFLASYYQQNGTKPNVRVYDTTKDSDVQRVYALAIEEGADFVVGPLSKEDVHRLSMLPPRALKTPVLALNHHPGVQSAPKHFVQYTLAPEAEAEQIADKAWQKGYRSASLIVPDNVWGQRTASAFTTQWQKRGGRIIHTVHTNASQDQSAAVRRLLGIDESQKRANHIKNILSEKVEFQPRRRQDVDVIVMAAPPDQARQLKPLFDFYYAEDVPVYATSSVYSGNPNPKRDRDINGIVFCDMPWLIDQQQGQNMRQLLNRNGANQSDQYNRLFAMGVDAYQLTTHFKQLQTGTKYPGVTGDLALGSNNHIQRQLSWAKVVDGVPSKVN